MRFVVVQGSVVPAQLAPMLREALKDSGAHLNSVYRGDEAAALLHKLGKHTQRELYQGWVHHKPGFLPANRPGTSTHELFNDGVAYKGKPGARLAWWQVGVDVNDADVAKLIAAAKKLGWQVSRTYPLSKSEYHHVNFRKPPVVRRIVAPIKARKITKLSAKGAQFVGRFEGFVNHPYNDPAGYATIGFGHLIGKRRVTPADRAHWGTITLKRGYALLQQDAEVAAAAVREHVRVTLKQSEFDALVSFVYNVGVGAFLGSTLLRALNAGHRAKAADELLKWDRAGGREMPGLHKRRVAERHLFLTGSYK